MTAETCPHEPAVVEMARSGESSESLRAHLRECAACAESERITLWMGSAAELLGRARPAPDPSYIWLRAEIGKRAEAAKRTLRDRLIALVLIGLTVGISGALGMLTLWPEVPAAISAGRSWFVTTVEQASVVDMTVIGTAWLGIPVLVVAIYFAVFKPLR